MKKIRLMLFIVLVWNNTIAQNAKVKIRSVEVSSNSNKIVEKISTKLFLSLVQGNEKLILEVSKKDSISAVKIGTISLVVKSINSKTIDITQSVIELSSTDGSKEIILTSTSIKNDKRIAQFDTIFINFEKNCYSINSPFSTIENCCKNNVGVVNYILDLCAVDYCYGVKRPSLKSNGKYCKNKQLFVRNSDLLSFMIINNNPFRYELEVNHKDISFNTNHDDFDMYVKRLAGEDTTDKEQKEIEQLDSDKIDTAKTITSLKEVIEKSFSDLDNIVLDLKNYIKSKTSQNCIDAGEVNSDLEKFGKRYIELFDHSTAELFFKTKIAELKSLVKKDEKVEIDKLEVQAKKYVEVVVKEVQNLMEKLIQSNYEYALLPIQVSDDNADVIQIEVKRKDLITKASVPYTYNFYVKNGLKIDFSAGPFLSTLVDHKYAIEATTDVVQGSTGDSTITKNLIRKQASDNFAYMLTSLMHVYSRWGNYVNGSLFLGAGFGNQQKAYLLAGGSLLLGREQRFCLNVGAAFGNAIRLAKPYMLGSEYKGTDAVPTVEVYTAGWVFGITYNLSKPKVVTKTE